MKIKISDKPLKKFYLKCTIFVVFLLICLVVGYWRKAKEDASHAVFGKKSYFVPFQLRGFSEANIPYLMVDIEKRQFNAKVDLGFAGEISLPSHILADITEKKFLENMAGYGLAGKHYHKELYQIGNVHIQKVSFSPVFAEKLNVEYEADVKLGELKAGPDPEFSRIGWRLFRRFNLLIDLKNSQLALCDSLQTLKSEGYPVESFISLPLVLDRGLLEFEAHTPSRKLCCILDTGSTWNMLNHHEQLAIHPNTQNLVQFEPNNTCEMAHCIIGEKEFGPLTFNRIHSPLAIDAIMGVEFFESHLLFVDFQQKRLYVYKYPEEE